MCPYDHLVPSHAHDEENRDQTHGREPRQKGIRNRSDCLRIWNYIETDPAKWPEDEYYEEEEREQT